MTRKPGPGVTLLSGLAIMGSLLVSQPLAASATPERDSLQGASVLADTAIIRAAARAAPCPPGFARKRPKPGSIWSGPKEAWCAWPQGPAPERSTPDDLDGGPGTVPPPSIGFLSPLLLFLKSLPTLEEVAAYFSDALGQPPVLEAEDSNVPRKLRFERLLFFSWGHSWRRCVLFEGTRRGPGVTLEWWTNDDFGLSELREFFEAPFFRPCESEQFYRWLAEEGVHESDFRGHRLRMAVQLQEEVLFVRIQWWRPAPEGIAAQEATTGTPPFLNSRPPPDEARLPGTKRRPRIQTG